VQYLQRAFGSFDVELVARRALECPAAIGPDLGRDAERAQEAEGAARDCRVGDVQMYGDLTTPAKVDAAGRVKEPGELREPIAVAPRGDPRELVAEVLRE
jgi:hypothetical protein